MRTLGVVGLGFVGTALCEGMKHAFDIIGYDKANGMMHHRTGHGFKTADKPGPPPDFQEGLRTVVEMSDGPIFVCVPTPMRVDNSCNTSIVEEVVLAIHEITQQMKDEHHDSMNKRVVVIKSTVVPGTTERLNNQSPGIVVCFNPEFLTERNALDDFKNQDRIIIGGPHSGTAVLKQMYNTAYPNVPVTKTSSTIAEMIKYVTNSFLATKVAFANEIEQICGELQIDYDKVIEYATKDKRLGQSHWAVPGPDGDRGFGGSCFPTALNALIKHAESLGVQPKVMRAAWEKNLEVRPGRDWEQLKGRAVTE